MRRVVMILSLIVIAGLLYSESSFEKFSKTIQGRKDLFWGVGEAEEQSEVSEICRAELAKSISTWYLTERWLQNRISYGRRDQYERMVSVWLGSMIDEITIERGSDKDFQEIWYISQDRIKEYYSAKEGEIEQYIVRGMQALELNKLGIFFRSLYMALVEIDLLAGKPVILDGREWNSEALITEITTVQESLVIKIAGNHYEAGNRRLILQLLYEKRPVNDLRLGLLTGDEYKYYSVSDRYLQIDLFGYEYAEIENLSFRIDIQDSETHAWGEEIRELSNITGMSGYEAYRTIPLRKVEFSQTNWEDVRLPVENDELVLETRIRNLLYNIEADSIYNADIFSSDEVRERFLLLQQKMKLGNMVVDPGIKRTELIDGIMWRGFDVQIQFAGGLHSMTNLVVITDSENKISDLWLGMKPLDFRLLSRKYNNSTEINELLATVELIEKQYTGAICGDQLAIAGYPESPDEGWFWVEMEDINIEVMENGVVYSYRLLVAGADESREFDLKGIKE